MQIKTLIILLFFLIIIEITKKKRKICSYKSPHAYSLTFSFLKIKKMNLSEVLQEPLEPFQSPYNWVNREFANTIMVFLNVVYIPISSAFTVSSSCRKNDACKAFWDIFSRIYVQVDATKMQIVNVLPSNKERYPGFWQYNLMFVDSFESFLALDVAWYTNKYDNNEYYYIYLQTDDDLLEMNMQKIFQYCWDNQLIHCSIQTQTPSKDILIYTYYPFTEKHCYEVKPQLIGKFINITKIREFFPRKLVNLYGCPLTAALFDVPPYISIRKNEQKKYEINGGFEGELLYHLQKYVNFRLDICVPPNDEKRGKIISHNNVTGAIGMLLRHEAHFSLGGFRQNYERINLLTSTLSHYQTSLVLVLKRAGFKLRSYEMFFFAFKLELWIMIVFVHLIVFIYAALTQYFWNGSVTIYSIIFRMFASLLGHNITLTTTGMFGSFETICWLFYTLLLRCIYTAALYHILRSNLSITPPQTLQDLVHERYRIVSNDITYDSMKEIYKLHDLKYTVINTSNDFISLEYILKHDGRLAAAIPFDFVSYFKLNHNMNHTDVFYVLPFDIIGLSFSMFLSKHSFLIHEFDEYLMTMTDCGLLNYWAKNELKQNDDEQVTTTSKEGTLFTMEILYFPFELYMCGNILACIIFFCELFIQHLKKRSA